VLSKSQPNSPPQQRNKLSNVQHSNNLHHLHNHLNNNKAESNGTSTTLNNRWNSLDLSATPVTSNNQLGCSGSMSSGLATSSGSDDSDLASDRYFTTPT